MNELPYEIFSVALSDKTGIVEFENSRASSCNRTVEGVVTSIPTIMVRRTTLDHFLEEHFDSLPPIDAIKIDVEGHENSVLRGMKETLAKLRPRVVMFEYLMRTDIQQTLAIFEDVGYSVFELSTSGAQRITDPAHVRPLQDLFACPNENSHDFEM